MKMTTTKAQALKLGMSSLYGKTMTIDQRIGAIFRKRRNELGLSQSEVAVLMKITFQQVQKYEKGANAMNAARLFQAGHILKMPVSAFFEAYQPYPGDASERESLELMKAFKQIKSPVVRKRMSDLVRALV